MRKQELAAQLVGVAIERELMLAQLRRLADCSTCKHDNECGYDSDVCATCSRGQHWEWDGGSRER